MSVIGLVQAGAVTMQAAIDAVERFGADPDTLGIRLAVAQLLLLQQEDATASGDEEYLLAAYRDWLGVANRFFRPGSEVTDREYSRSAAILLAELRLAGIAASPVGAPVEANGGAAADAPRLTR